MVKLNAWRFDRKTNTPVLYDREIDEFAHAVLADYKPKLLREPGAIRFEHFLESYLGVNILYQDIYNDDPERPIFGATALRDGILKVFDRENNCVACIPVPANTVVIDNYVMRPGKEPLGRFTGLHEGGHILIHGSIYDTVCDGQLELPGIESQPVIYCRRSNIENFADNKPNRTISDWREHHADYFAAAIAMPNATFRPVVHSILREHGIRTGYIAPDIDDDLTYLSEELLPETIMEIYGVSKRAAKIKLRKAGFVGERRAYGRSYPQMRL